MLKCCVSLFKSQILREGVFFFFFSPLHSHLVCLKDAFCIKAFDYMMIDLPRPLTRSKANFHLPCWKGTERRGAGEGRTLLYGVCRLHYAGPYYENI